MPYAPNYYTTHKQTRWVRALFSTQNTETDEITHTKTRSSDIEENSHLVFSTRRATHTAPQALNSSLPVQNNTTLSLSSYLLRAHTALPIMPTHQPPPHWPFCCRVRLLFCPRSPQHPHLPLWPYSYPLTPHRRLTQNPEHHSPPTHPPTKA